jgi:hypothetical protein
MPSVMFRCCVLYHFRLTGEGIEDLRLIQFGDEGRKSRLKGVKLGVQIGP